MEFCRRSPHSVVAIQCLQFSDHLAEISVPWQLNSKNKTKQNNPKTFWMASTRWDNVFHFAFCSSCHELGHYAAKFRSELIVFGSAVSDGIRNHIASVLLESVNIFFVFLLFFWLPNDHFFSILVEFGLRVSSHLYFIGFWVSGP